MAISKVQFTRSDGNLSAPIVGEDHISALIFDVKTFPGSYADGDIFEVTSARDAETLGVTEYDSTSGATNYEYGIPYLHISEFFRVRPSATLFIAFADCTANWDIISQVQRFAQGKVRQVGVWTRRKLFEPGTTTSDPYVLRLVNDLNAKAEELAAINQPISILLAANGAGIETTTMVTNLSLIPDISKDNYPRVTALLGQGHSSAIQAMQFADTTHAMVGMVGVTLGLVSKCPVGTSIAWVGQFDCSGGHMDRLALGFGDTTVSGSALANVYPFEILTDAQVDALETKGYVFPIKYVGISGSYMSSSRTVSSGDYRTIERNRVIDKSRRNLRTVLLPFLNSPVKVAPTTGALSPAQIKIYKVACENVLQAMQNDGEISGFKVNIDPKQNILLTDSLKIAYVIVPNGKASNINVIEGFALTTA